MLWIHASNSARFGQSVRFALDQLRIYGRKDPKADILQLLCDWLRDRDKGRWLIVLDNADDASFLLDSPTTSVEQPAQRRIDYIPSCDHGTVIMTTRSKKDALKLVYESETIDVLPMSGDEAEALLDRKLGKSNPDSRRLVRALDHIPLAITQAAAYICERAPRCSVQQYLEAMEQSRASRMSLLQRDFPLPSRDAEATNSVLLTWQISFEHVYSTRKSAAELLSLMSFCERQAIPESLLLSGSVTKIQDSPSLSTTNDVINAREASESRFEEDIVLLRSFAFISTTPDKASWTLHRLVQDATHLWLTNRGQLSKFHTRFVHNLCQAFPTGDFENWETCRMLLPHAQCAAKQEPVEQGELLEWACIMYNAAWYACTQGSAADAIAMASQSMQARLMQLGAENELTLHSMSMVALAHKMAGRSEQARQLEVRVVETSIAVLGEVHPDTLVSMCELSLTYREQGLWKEAEQLEIKALETSTAVLGENDLITLKCMTNLAATYWDQGRSNEAEQLDVKVMETSKALLGELHPDTLLSIANLAATYRNQERWDEAEQLELKVTEARKAILGEEHPDTLTGMANLAATYWNQGRCDEAEQLEMTIVETSKTVLGEKHPDTLKWIGNLASTYHNQDRWTEAEQLEIKVMEARKEVLGEEHPDTLTSMGNLALTYWNQGRWREAEQLQLLAAEGNKKVLGADHPYTLLAMENLEEFRSAGRQNSAAASPLQTRLVDMAGDLDSGNRRRHWWQKLAGKF